MRVSVCVTCLGDVFFAEAAADAVRLLRSLGVTVEFPSDQTCCGQPAWNAGRHPLAKRLAEHHQRAFREAAHVVVLSGSCTAMIKHTHPRLLGPGGTDGSPRVWELTELLADRLAGERLGDGLSGVRVAYHHGCHALREMRIREGPLDLLRGAGAEIVPWSAGETCCGFGGLFSVKLPEVSVSMADHKLDTLPEDAVLTSGDGGCLMQLAGRLTERGRELPVVPLATLLWRARASRPEAVPKPPPTGPSAR